MTRRSSLREPNARDLSRLLLARASSKVALTRAEDEFLKARYTALYTEIAATVRFASPFLLALLDAASLTLADVVFEMMPAPGWPAEPVIPAHRALAGVARATAPRAIPAWVDETWAWGPRTTPMHGTDIILPTGIHLHLRVVDHSIEAAGRIAGYWFVSLFGTLSVRAPMARRVIVPARTIGSRLEDVIRIPAALEKGWIVEAIGPADEQWDLKLAVNTGVRRCRLRLSAMR